MSVSIKTIFLANQNWQSYQDKYHFMIRPIERQEVEKMLKCRDYTQGHTTYECPKCGSVVRFRFVDKEREASAMDEEEEPGFIRPPWKAAEKG